MKLLVCGTRLPKKYRNQYAKLVVNYLTSLNYLKDISIIEGCCKDSADEFAEICASFFNIAIQHYPSKAKPLYRNIEMCGDCDEVVAFWDGYSYGTAHTISTAIMLNKKVTIVKLDFKLNTEE